MILDQIVSSTRIRVEKAKENEPLNSIQERALSLGNANFTFEENLRKPGLSYICEVKKASPSKGIISLDFPYLDIAKTYQDSGADAISVLTEPEYFLGSNSYLQEITQVVNIPVLRKDFTIDEYQIYEAKVIGASAILLICSILTDQQLVAFSEIAKSLGLSVLVETHNEEEIKRALATGASVIGVNNRNLQDFTVDINLSIQLRNLVPSDVIFVSESGISTKNDIQLLEANHVDAVLIGEALMRQHGQNIYLS